MKKSMKYMAVTTAAAVMVMGSLSIGYADGTEYSLAGSSMPSAPTPSTPSTPSSPNTTTTTVNKGWVQVTENRETVWKYYNENGTMLKSQWFCSPSSGIWYYLDKNGTMVTGWGQDREIEGYWFDSSGAMATGWRLISLEEEQTYGPSSGSGEKGYFYFGGNGKVCQGWTRIGESWYFLNDGYADDFADYQMVYGEVTIDNEEYYFGTSTDGSMKTGLVKVISESSSGPGSKNNECYYLYRDNGMRVQEGWGRYNGVWYYVNEVGEIVVNDLLMLDSYDRMVTDIDYAATVYYMDANGVMKTGWVELGASQEVRPGVVQGKANYFFNSNGTMATGWKKDGNKWYYLATETDSSYKRGQMYSSGIAEIDNNTYFFNTNGEMAISAWKENDQIQGTSYFNEDGKMIKAAEGELRLERISSKYYVFDDKGARLQDTTIYTGENGKWTTEKSKAVLNKDMYTINRSGIASKSTYRG